MKKILSTSIFVLVATMLFAQIPQAFNYQAIVRDQNSQILVDQHVGVRVSLLAGDALGPILYTETHLIKTNPFGLVNIAIGTGEAKNGLFSEIDWSRNPYFIKFELDIKGGINYKEMGTSQILSVPYALYAETSGDSQRGTTEWDNNGSDIFSDESNFPDAKVGIGTTNPGAKLDIYDIGYSNPNAPMLLVQHQNGFSSTFRRNINGKANALFLLQKSRGTLGSPAVVLPGDYIGQVRMEGYDGSDYKTAGWMRIAVDGTVSSGIVPGALLFATTSTSGVVSERMRITSDGNVGIGTVVPIAPLHVSGIIRSDSGYNHNDNQGISDTINVVVDNDYTAEKLKYRTLIFSGGILIYASDTSSWVDSVGAAIVCGQDIYDSRDGQTYGTVLIGSQCWMSENLNIGTKINSSGPGYLQTDNGVIEKYCYDNATNFCDVYGGLYEWGEMMQYATTEGVQGICPAGWHIPTDDEWKILEGTVDSQYGVGDPEWDGQNWRGFDAGNNLKSTSGWGSSGNGTDLYGFSALPAGHRKGNPGDFQFLGGATDLWTSTEFDGSTALLRSLWGSMDEVDRPSQSKSYGYSVRCLKDD